MSYPVSSATFNPGAGVLMIVDHLASGGKLTIPTFKPFAEDPTKTSAVNSTMGYGMTIELDFKIQAVLDYEAELIKCYSKDNNNNNLVFK